MDDGSLLAALRSGRSGGLAGIYDGYGDRLLAYAVTLTPEPAAAAAAVQDALLVAQVRADHLPAGDRLRAWLYALVRNECVRGRPPAPAEREVLELTGRHELSEAEVAAVLGLPATTVARLTALPGEPVPFELAPPELRQRVLGQAELTEYPQRLAERAGPWRADGFPVPLGRPRRPDLRRSPIWWSAAALAVVVLLITTGLALQPDAGTLATTAGERLQTALPAGDRTGDDGARTTAPGRTPGPTTSPSGPGPRPPEPTGTPGPTAGPTPTMTPTGTPTAAGTPTTPTTPVPGPTTPPAATTTPAPPPTTTPAPVPAVVTRWTLVAPACPKNWRARLTATVTGTTATAMSAGFTGGGGVPSRAAMTSAGSGVWTLTLTLPAGRRLTWTATATTPAGRLASAARALSYACAP